MVGKCMEKQEREKIYIAMPLKIPILALTTGLRKRFTQSPCPGRSLL